MLRKTAASDPTTRGAKSEPRTFRSFTLEEAERAYAEAAPKGVEERMAPDFEAGEHAPDEIEPLEIVREAPIHERRALTPFANRSTRLVSATAAVTAGLVLAASLFPRQQTEPAAIIWDHARPAATAPAATPLRAPPPGVHNLLAKSTPARTARRGRAARHAHRTAASTRSRENASQCAAARVQAQKMHGSLAAKAQRRVREACGIQTAYATKPPIGYQTQDF
ncbi:MAG TPA: hypothetical protein VHY32_03405 [Caulobacteraceae bacterium]|nr:hypothetical protein [Caulobacteraceae bacterium]